MTNKNLDDILETIAELLLLDNGELLRRDCYDWDAVKRSDQYKNLSSKLNDAEKHQKLLSKPFSWYEKHLQEGHTIDEDPFHKGVFYCKGCNEFLFKTESKLANADKNEQITSIKCKNCLQINYVNLNTVHIEDNSPFVHYCTFCKSILEQK